MCWKDTRGFQGTRNVLFFHLGDGFVATLVFKSYMYALYTLLCFKFYCSTIQYPLNSGSRNFIIYHIITSLMLQQINFLVFLIIAEI